MRITYFKIFGSWINHIEGNLFELNRAITKMILACPLPKVRIIDSWWSKLVPVVVFEKPDTTDENDYALIISKRASKIKMWPEACGLVGSNVHESIMGPLIEKLEEAMNNIISFVINSRCMATVVVQMPSPSKSITVMRTTFDEADLLLMSGQKKAGLPIEPVHSGVPACPTNGYLPTIETKLFEAAVRELEPFGGTHCLSMMFRRPNGTVTGTYTTHPGNGDHMLYDYLGKIQDIQPIQHNKIEF